MVRDEAQRGPDAVLRDRLRELANERPRFGDRRLFVLLRRKGEPSGINRISREDGGGSENGPGDRFLTTLTAHKRKAQRKAIGTRALILIEARPNTRWSLDFVHEQFANDQRFRVRNVIDDVTRECFAAIPDTSIEDLQQAGPDQPFRGDRGTALTGIKPVELGIRRTQRVVDDGPVLAKRVSRWNALLKIDVAEQRTRHLI